MIANKIVVTIVRSVFTAVVGIIGGWVTRGKIENKIHAKEQAVIMALDKRLREVEKELLNAKNLSGDYISELKNERNALMAEIKRHKVA